MYGKLLNKLYCSPLYGLDQVHAQVMVARHEHHTLELGPPQLQSQPHCPQRVPQITYRARKEIVVLQINLVDSDDT